MERKSVKRDLRCRNCYYFENLILKCIKKRPLHHVTILWTQSILYNKLQFKCSSIFHENMFKCFTKKNLKIVVFKQMKRFHIYHVVVDICARNVFGSNKTCPTIKTKIWFQWPGFLKGELTTKCQNITSG